MKHANDAIDHCKLSWRYSQRTLWRWVEETEVKHPWRSPDHRTKEGAFSQAFGHTSAVEKGAKIDKRKSKKKIQGTCGSLRRAACTNTVSTVWMKCITKWGRSGRCKSRQQEADHVAIWERWFVVASLLAYEVKHINDSGGCLVGQMRR